MRSYERFAHVYDELMTDIPYDEYVEWVMQFAPIDTHKCLLDIGCGTGVLAAMFARAGYDVAGVDLSEDMLAVAHERFDAMGLSIPLYAMPMEELEGFHNIDVVVIPIDSLNYVRDTAAVEQTLARIYDALRDGGQLLFDVHSTFKTDDIFLDGPFTYDDGDITYVWHTEPTDEPHAVASQITFFVRTASNTFERFDEEHYQRTYDVSQYVAWLQQIGYRDIVVTADWSNEAPDDDSERIFIRAVK